MTTTTYYRDFYGCTASIKVNKDGTAKLTVCIYGKKYPKVYKTEKGAKIALSKWSNCWQKV